MKRTLSDGTKRIRKKGKKVFVRESVTAKAYNRAFLANVVRRRFRLFRRTYVTPDVEESVAFEQTRHKATRGPEGDASVVFSAHGTSRDRRVPRWSRPWRSGDAGTTTGVATPSACCSSPGRAAATRRSACRGIRGTLKLLPWLDTRCPGAGSRGTACNRSCVSRTSRYSRSWKPIWHMWGHTVVLVAPVSRSSR